MSLLSLNIPILYFSDLSVTGTVTLPIPAPPPPATVPSVFLYLKVDKTRFFDAGLNAASGGGFRYIKNKDSNGVIIGMQSAENDNIDYDHIVGRFDANATNWQINNNASSTGATFTLTTSTSSNPNGDLTGKCNPASLNTAFGMTKTGRHVLGLAACAYKGLQVTNLDVFGDSVAQGTTNVQTNIAASIRSYLSRKDKQEQILNTLIDQNLGMLPADDGYVTYENTWGDIALVFKLNGVKFDISKGTSTDNLVLNDVNLCLHLTASNNL